MLDHTFEHIISFITARINVTRSDGSGTSIGTGFMHTTPLNDGTDRSIVLLISNKHVYADPTSTLQIIMNKKTDTGEPDYGNTQAFSQNNFSDIYYPHPDDDVDLACINATQFSQGNVFYKILDKKFLEPYEEKEVAPGIDVLFVGYPENRFDVVNNLPIVRKGSIASLPSIDFNGKPQMIIDAQVFQGSSGSPVFVASKNRYTLLGVVSETMIRHSELQTLPTNHIGLGVQQILGLGLVIKYEKVIELIESATEQFLEREKASS